MPNYRVEHFPYDAIIAGAGPNGLAAAITLARAGRSVRVVEAHETIGGGARTAELTLPGFRHDVCSAIHPLGMASPFLRALPLHAFGLQWVFPAYALAHPLDDGTAMVIERSVAASAATLGEDAAAYHRLMAPLAGNWQKIVADLLGPLPLPPKHPLAVLPFGVLALFPAVGLAKIWFRGPRARAVFAGMAAHAFLPLEMPVTAAFGLMLAMLAHATGWPAARTGSQAVVDAMAGYLRSLGGVIQTGEAIHSLEQLSGGRAALLDVGPRQWLEIAGERLPPGYQKALRRYRYGPGVCKVDYALDGPVPWRAAACRQAGTVHLGGTLEEIAASERAAWNGEHAARPFVLAAQQSLFDPTRAPSGRHTLWTYCHVPHGSDRDMSAAIEAQIERFAPGFGKRILARRVHTALEMQAYNPNYVGGDINGGAQMLSQFFTRPVAQINPYATPLRGVYLCSASTPPGGGVHGMCGYYSARAALKEIG